MSNPKRRRIDRILDPSFTADLSELEAADLRDRLGEARREEEELSYVRRVLQGHIDMMGAELRRRGGEDTAPNQALEPKGRASRGARARVVSDAVQAVGRRRVERVISEGFLARLPDLPDDEIGQAISRAEEAERETSSARRDVHAVLDRLEGELASRYKAGLEPPV